MGLDFFIRLALLNRRAAATAAHRDRGSLPRPHLPAAFMVIPEIPRDEVHAGFHVLAYRRVWTLIASQQSGVGLDTLAPLNRILNFHIRERRSARIPIAVSIPVTGLGSSHGVSSVAGVFSYNSPWPARRHLGWYYLHQAFLMLLYLLLLLLLLCLHIAHRD